MFKLILVASALAVVISVQNFKPSKVATKPTETILPVFNKPIALVKYKDMIYHCQGIVKTNCGHSLHCGRMSVHCVTNFEVEYLN